MVNPIISNVPGKPVDPGAEPGGGLAGPLKTSESKFDQVRARLLDQQAEQVKMPPAVEQVSPEQQRVLQAQLSKRLEGAKRVSAHQLYAVEMKGAKEKVDRLTKQVNALPKTSAFEPFRNRLATIDAQYRSTGHLVNAVKSTASPEEFMKIQMKMYQLAENLELMSKVVEQVTSGMKSILQTQL